MKIKLFEEWVSTSTLDYNDSPDIKQQVSTPSSDMSSDIKQQSNITKNIPSQSIQNDNKIDIMNRNSDEIQDISDMKKLIQILDGGKDLLNSNEFKQIFQIVLRLKNKKYYKNGEAYQIRGGVTEIVSANNYYKLILIKDSKSKGAAIYFIDNKEQNDASDNWKSTDRKHFRYMTLTQFNLIIYSMDDIYKIKYFQKEESKNPGSYQKHIQQYKDSLEKRLSQVGV